MCFSVQIFIMQTITNRACFYRMGWCTLSFTLSNYNLRAFEVVLKRKLIYLFYVFYIFMNYVRSFFSEFLFANHFEKKKILKKTNKINFNFFFSFLSFIVFIFRTGYPLAIIYRKQIHTQQPRLIRHLYILLCGLLICLFNYGWLVYHSLTAIIVSYAFITLFNGTTLVALSFLFHMTYLLIGYYTTATETYDITWTMPHCVLTLRLIGLAFDIADGQRPIDQLSSTQKKSIITQKPSFLEIAAFTYFPASFLVGPQFSFRRYTSFINNEFDKYDGYLSAGGKRAAVGACYLIINVVGSGYLNDKYVISSDFSENHGILMRMLLIGLWGRITLYKYISCWLLTESVAICFGKFLFFFSFFLHFIQK